MERRKGKKNYTSKFGMSLKGLPLVDKAKLKRKLGVLVPFFFYDRDAQQ